VVTVLETKDLAYILTHGPRSSRCTSVCADVGMLGGCLYQIRDMGMAKTQPRVALGKQHDHDNMLSSNEAGIGDSCPYIDAMAPLVRFSLVHRSAT
jgi:hypothetical protein